MRFGDIATATTGVIFMSTPHRTSSGDGLKNLCLLILKSVPSTLSKELLSALEQSEFRLDDISALFGEINPMVEILTVFEGLQTKIKEPRLIQRSKSMLVILLFSPVKRLIRLIERIACRQGSGYNRPKQRTSNPTFERPCGGELAGGFQWVRISRD